MVLIVPINGIKSHFRFNRTSTNKLFSNNSFSHVKISVQENNVRGKTIVIVGDHKDIYKKNMEKLVRN